MVTRGIPELEEDAVAGKTETDALESSRKILDDLEERTRNRQGEKKFLHARQLVF